MYNEHEPTSSFLVEYWVRQEWHHTEAHADMDEGWFQQEGTLRHPYKGHVLYLTKGTQVNGPTVIFADVMCEEEMYDTSKEQEVLLVLFQQGRLLQFEGNVLHAVPRPTTTWMHPELNKEPLQHEPFEEFGRSVILFNLWKADKPPPMGLQYIQKSDNDSANESLDNDSLEQLHCNDKSTWKQAPVVSDWQGTLWDTLMARILEFQLPLMGNVVRRGMQDLSLLLQATSLVEDALQQSMEDVRPK